MPVPDGLIPAEVVFQRAHENRGIKIWPSRGPTSRLDPVADPSVRPRFGISRDDAVFTIGSCFARNIEQHLARLGMKVPTLSLTLGADEVSGEDNAVLNKYTPVSMLQEVEMALRWRDATPAERERLLAESLVEVDGGAVMDLGQSKLLPVPRERALAIRREILDLYLQGFQCGVIVITLGLVEAWYDHATGQWVDLAPSPRVVKDHPGRFGFVQLSYEDCLAATDRLVALLSGNGCAKRILMTTSPVPLGRTFTEDDVLVANTHSKAVLRTVSAEIRRRHANVDYFPSFEMVMLSRAPEVWHNDLQHVEHAFIGRVVGKMVDAYLPAPDADQAAANAWFAIGAGRHGDALRMLEQLGGESAPALQVLKGLALIGAGDEAAGRALIIASAPHADLPPVQALHAASTLARAGNLEAATIVLERALPAAPLKSDIRSQLLARLALACFYLGDPARAEALATEALGERQGPWALIAAGEVARRQGRGDEARTYFNRAAKAKGPRSKIQFPPRGIAYYGLGLLAHEEGKRKLRERYCELALLDLNAEVHRAGVQALMEGAPANVDAMF